VEEPSTASKADIPPGIFCDAAALSRLLEINRPYLYIRSVAPARPALAHHFIASTSSQAAARAR
jgi:hypothetical protein